MGLYEQSTPESNSEGLKQLLKSNGFQDIYKTNDTFSKTNSNGEEFVFKFPNPQYEVKEHKVRLSVKNPSETTIKEFGLIQNKSYPKYYDDSNNGWLYWEDASKLPTRGVFYFPKTRPPYFKKVLYTEKKFLEKIW